MKDVTKLTVDWSQSLIKTKRTFHVPATLDGQSDARNRYGPTAAVLPATVGYTYPQVDGLLHEHDIVHYNAVRVV